MYAPPDLRVIGDYVAVVEGVETTVSTLNLTTQPTTLVTITIQPDLQTTVFPQNIVFTTNNWDEPQMVMVTAVDDTNMEHRHQSQIRHNIQSDDPDYQNT